jgi:hypothetical protein
MGFAFKPSKQLISNTNYEFFRLFISSDGTYGSLPRALGALCSGQWSNSVKAKFIDPASKLSSVIEIARKVGRRSGGNITFMDKLCTMAFRKWATFDEKRLVEGYVHGRKMQGGLGIPTADGSIYDIQPVVKSEQHQVELIGIPMDASLPVAIKQVKEATDILGKDCVVDARQLAEQMSRSVFMGNIAATEGVGVAQRIASVEVPTRVVILKKESIHKEAYNDLRVDCFHSAQAKYADLAERYSKAGRRYDALSTAVKPRYKRLLADAIALGIGVNGARLHFWKEELTLYGCGTYLLTEDYYDIVQRLAIITADSCTDKAVSERLAYYACSIANSGLMNY